jgi:hypothetical protein
VLPSYTDVPSRRDDMSYRPCTSLQLVIAIVRNVQSRINFSTVSLISETVSNW